MQRVRASCWAVVFSRGETLFKKIGEPQVYLDMLTERPSLLVTRRILSFILIYSRRTLTLSFRHGAVCRWQPWRCKALSQSGDGVLLKPRLATWSLGAPPGLVPCVRGFGREPSSLAFAWWFLSDNRIRGLFQSDLEVRRIYSLLERWSLSGQPTWCRQETGTHLHTKFTVRAFHEQPVEIKPVCGSEIVADSGTKHVSTRVLETCLEQLGVRITQLDAKAQTIDMVRVGSWVDDVVMVAMFRGWVVASADPEGCDVCNGDVLRLGFFASKGTEVQNVADRVRRTLVWPRWVLGACYAQCTKVAWIWLEMQGRMVYDVMQWLLGVAMVRSWHSGMTSEYGVCHERSTKPQRISCGTCLNAHGSCATSEKRRPRNATEQVGQQQSPQITLTSYSWGRALMT